MPSDELRRITDFYQTSDRELARRYLADRFPEFSRNYFEAALAHRYDLYPHIPQVAEFETFRDCNVLEIGVGQGADHYMFARAGARVSGIDATRKHCEITQLFLETFGLESRVIQADALDLPFANGSIDHVYSCGVLLLIGDIQRAIAEIHRVLRHGGSATIMLYNKASIHYWIKTRLYYGWALDEDRVVGRDTTIDWCTDGAGYPKTYHYGPADVPRLFGQFSRCEWRTECLTPEQVPLVGLPALEPVRRYLETRYGFFLWVRCFK